MGVSDGVGVGVGVGVSDGVGVGVLDGVGVGETEGVGVDDGWPPMLAGFGNGITSVPSSATCIMAVQIRAGNEPPVTVARPPTPSREIGLPCLSLRNSTTAVDSWGV